MAYQCSICHKSYTTASHLSRHVITHQLDRQFKCAYCSKGFVRQDVARRHSKTCPKRQDQPLPQSRSRGRPRKVCNRCSVVKTSCDRKNPCGSCAQSVSQCSYDRLTSGFTTLTQTLSIGDITHIQPRNATKGSTGAAINAPFLVSLTVPESGSPQDIAQALEMLRGQSDGTLTQDEVDHRIVPLCSPAFLTPFCIADVLRLDVSENSLTLFDLCPGDTAETDAYEDILQNRTSAMIALFSEKDKLDVYRDTVAVLLTPINLGLCVDSFFRYAYRHVPIIHKPSFDIGNVDLLLLLSIFVVGAIWSYPRDTYYLVLDIVELVERCVFEHVVFEQLRDSDTKTVNLSSPGVLSFLQAATMLVFISFALPNAKHRERFRNRRFPDMIAMKELFKVTNDESLSIPTGTDFSWTNYIFRESCSRVGYYLYLLDCHVSTIYAVLPRISVVEMQAPLPSDEYTFGAENAERCHDRLSSFRAAPRLTLVDVVRKLIAVEPIGSDLFNLSAFPLLLVIEALQAMICTAKSQLLDTPEMVRLECALIRWKEIWDYSQNSGNSSEGAGFMIHAQEIWLLARKLFKSDAASLKPRMGVDGPAKMSQWLAELD